MPYTSNQKVQDLLETGGDYNGRTNLTRAVTGANILTRNVVDNAATNGLTALASDVLEQIATYLGAHLYQQSDKGYTRRKTGQREGYFQIQVGKGLDSTLYGQTAQLFDTTGYLMGLDKQGDIEVQVLWLGKRPSEQIPTRLRW
jgi:hypothetical protein